MAKVTGFTAERMLAIENSCIVGGAVDLEGRLKLARRDGEIVDGGSIYPSAAVVRAMVHDIGDVVITTKNVNPETRYGGTWAQIGQGRTLVGVDTTDADFATAKKTGGAKTLPAHTHTINHDHASVTSGSSGAHAHAVDPPSTTSSSDGAHTHTMAHTHTINHDHPSATTSSSGSHTHNGSGVSGRNWLANGPGTNAGLTTGGGSYVQVGMDSAGAHTHTVNIANFTGTSGASSAASTGSAGAHTHTVNIASFTSGSAGDHTHTVDLPSYSGASGSTGTGNHGVVQPYYTVYFWERIA